VEEYPIWEHTASGGRPTGASRRARVLRFDNLQVRSRYVALSVDSKAESFANSLVNLIHVFGPRGELRQLTLGLPLPRHQAMWKLCRQAKRLAESYGKKMGLHMGPVVECEAMDIHWDWRAWIDEGLADSLTMKELWPNTRLAEDVLSHARPRGIPVIFSPYANTIWHQPDPEALCAHRIQLARTYGYDGFQFYESAAITLATEDGRIVMTRPRLREIFRTMFGK
jgi:hypothetical protein